jgi:hypothetical protein
MCYVEHFFIVIVSTYVSLIRLTTFVGHLHDLRATVFLLLL